jgi:predicted dienelactone hydrolase
MLDGPAGAAWARLGSAVPGGRLASGGGPYPVVLVSHGTGGAARDLGWLGSRLAARGFVVLGVDHHGNTRDEPYVPEGFLCWWERARDLSILLDQLAAAGPFRGALDRSRVHAAGFSLGGHTALALAGAVTDMPAFARWIAGQPAAPGPREFPDAPRHIQRLFAESRVFRDSWARHGASFAQDGLRAVLACAPAPPIRAFTQASLRHIARPVATVFGGADTDAPPETCARWLHAQLGDDRLIDLGPAVGHAVFLNPGTALGRRSDPIAFADAPGVQRAAIHDTVAALALDLFAA